MNSTPARDALDIVADVRPQWCAVTPAREAVGLPARTLLHAGPPFADPRKPSAPVLSSAVLCCLYEGWTAGEAQAERLIAEGGVTLASAQTYRVVTPLAAVVSPRTALVEVRDANSDEAGDARSWSLLGSGAGPQIRFGSRDPRIVERMRWRDEVLAPSLSHALADAPIDLRAIAELGLANGDDLHARTTRASAALREQLSPRVTDAASDDIDAMLAQTPLFFLTLWMAACHRMLSACTCASDASTQVIALAGNGSEVGIRLAGDPSRWFTAPATPPAGPRIDVANLAAVAGLTGDSGVIDAAGFGAQALANAPEPREVFAPFLPPDWRESQPPLFARNASGVAVLDASRVANARVAPLAAIAMIGADGRAGLIGRGVYTAPVELFERAARDVANMRGVRA